MCHVLWYSYLASVAMALSVPVGSSYSARCPIQERQNIWNDSIFSSLHTTYILDIGNQMIKFTHLIFPKRKFENCGHFSRCIVRDQCTD
mmetsp:Transcript_10959/g.23220  ORF Transcript_10959/g.23220 Transcript_10959/m.23220 type:complete len:89 (+) Transcript_10959:48-314(+)